MIKIKIWSITGYMWINLFKLWPTEIGVNHHNIYMEKCQKKGGIIGYTVRASTEILNVII